MLDWHDGFRVVNPEIMTKYPSMHPSTQRTSEVLEFSTEIAHH